MRVLAAVYGSVAGVFLRATTLVFVSGGLDEGTDPARLGDIDVGKAHHRTNWLLLFEGRTPLTTAHSCPAEFGFQAASPLHVQEEHMSRTRRTLTRRLVGVLLVLASTLGVGAVAASPAQAGSYNCWSRTATWQTQAYGACSGTSDFKVAIVCKNWLGWSAYREGAWTNPVWTPAWATCPAGYTVQSSWMLSRWN
jgi:hypothetical protein